MSSTEPLMALHEERVPFRLGLIAAVILGMAAVWMLVLFFLQTANGPVGSRPAASWVCSPPASTR